MVRKLSLAIAFALGIVPLGANALGLGDIHLKSALNQHLNADISLLSVNEDEIPDIKVQLASPEVFQRAGVDRPYLLSKLRFKPVVIEGGAVAIQVSSLEAIREPFLNFLIEINWPKGKLVREYTVLLDPPVTLDRRPAPVQQATARTQRSAARPAASPVGGGQSVVTPADVAWAGSGTGTDTLDEYGPVKRNDTLWGVAKKTRHQGATMNQMMISLFQANPQAFIKSNINNLKTGEVLRVPSRDEVLGLSASRANTVYRDHLNEWRADRNPTMEEERAAARTTLSPAANTSVEEPAPAAELKIASARPEGSGAAGSGDSKDKAQVMQQLQQELLAAQEDRQSAVQEGEELRSRVDDLESQLEDMQRLLTLKSEQFAQMQAAVAVQQQGIEAVDAKTMADAGAEVVADKLAEPAVTPALTKTEPKQVAKQPAAVTAAKPASAVKPVTAAKPMAAVEPKERGILDRLGADPTMLGVGVAIVVVLLALLWVIISRRRSTSADFQESILISTIDDADSEQLDADGIDSQSQVEESSFLSDFSPSDIDALQDETGEVDPLAEADVYIAYGRYQQAEDLIRQAIEKSPEREELQFKLFEILYATKDKASFVQQAEAAATAGLDKKDSTAWGKVVAMGGQLAAGHALFVGAESSAVGGDALEDLEFDINSGLDDEADDDLSDLNLNSLDELGDFEEDDLDADSIGGETVDGDSLNLDLELGDMDDEDSGDLGLDLDDLSDLGQFSLGDAEEEEIDGDKVDADSLDLNIDFGSPADDESDSEVLGFDLDELADEESDNEEAPLKIEDTLASAEITDLDRDHSLKEAEEDLRFELPDEEGDSDDAYSLEDDSALSSLQADDDLGEMDSILIQGAGDGLDEISTKMDLARAYVDMGDEEGALSILNEVISEGNEAQQQEAQALLDQLS